MSAGRRQPPPMPQGATPSPEQHWKKLLELWRGVLNGYSGLPAEHGFTHAVDGRDPLDAPGAPTTIRPDDVASVGVGPSFAREDHRHAVATDAAVGLGNTSSEGVSTSFARADHVHKRDIRVKAAAADVGTRNALNFSAAFTVTDNPGSDRVDVDVAGLSPVDLEFLAWII